MFRYGTQISVHIIPICMALVGVARTGSVYVTMTITVERYFAIVHPLKDFITIKKFLLPITVVFSILYNLPKVICLILVGLASFIGDVTNYLECVRHYD